MEIPTINLVNDDGRVVIVNEGSETQVWFEERGFRPVEAAPAVEDTSETAPEPVKKSRGRKKKSKEER